ncbi:MAG: DUF5698 domain-containing protein [Gemmatales bacterium]|nr:DUF5698 domain-containing protein [Gemmatales bacterium]MDW7993976.1 DUF5698 domain-containing protein [Gemmatales bacterium]
MEAWQSAAWTLVVFVAETCVVTLSTIRTILIARHQRVLAPLLGLVEITLWLLAITQVISNLKRPSYFVAFVAGFGVGNYLGVCLEEWMALGYAVVQIVTRKDPRAMVQAFSEARFGVTRLDGHGVMGPVHLLFSVVPRAKLAEVSQLIEATDPEAFYTVEELRSIRRGFLPPAMVFPLWSTRRGMPVANLGGSEARAPSCEKILRKSC